MTQFLQTAPSLFRTQNFLEYSHPIQQQPASPLSDIIQARHSLGATSAVYTPVPETDWYTQFYQLLRSFIVAMQGPKEQVHHAVCDYEGNLKVFLEHWMPIVYSGNVMTDKETTQRCIDFFCQHHEQLTHILDNCTHVNINAEDFSLMQDAALQFAILRDNLVFQHDPDWQRMAEQVRASHADMPAQVGS